MSTSTGRTAGTADSPDLLLMRRGEDLDDLATEHHPVNAPIVGMQKFETEYL
jgi:hypothetical protein